MKLKLTPFNVCTMLNSISPLIRQRIKENQLTFRIRCHAETGEIYGDEIRIKQVIFKLISNAIKFSKTNGNITLGANNHGDDEIVIWVEDKGIGIPAEEQQRVFEKFYKSSSLRSNDTGTGLGLSVVKNFVQLHGGRIELKSEPNIGTKFLCYFKRHASQTVSSLPNAAETTPDHAGSA
jgi:signal transduction histidine kinase